MNDFLQNLEPGDKVVQVSSGWGTDDTIQTVSRLTKTQVVLDNQRRYRKANGREVGSSGSPISYIVEFDEEKAKCIRQKSLAKKLQRFDWHRLDLHILESIAQTIRHG